VSLILLSESTVHCLNHCLSLNPTLKPVVFKILLRRSFSEPRLFLGYMHANWPLFRSTLDQPTLTNPHIRDHTDLEHSIQDFSSAVHEGTLTTISELTVRCHLLTLPPCPGQPNETQKLLPTALSKMSIPPVSSPSSTSVPCSHFPADSATKF
jgi:hypothetical protein